MGRQAYPIIGGIIGAAVVGFYTGGAGTLQGYAAGFALGSAAAGIAGSYLDPIVLQGNVVGDNPIQVAAEGGTRAIMYGQACISATCVIARGNRKVTKKKAANGKGSTGSTVNQTVTWTFAIGIGETVPGSMITRVWQDEGLVYDIINGGVSDDDNDTFRAKFRYYDGNETQLPDPDLQVFLADQTPYFRGTNYVVFPNFDLTQTAERIPTFKFEVIGNPGLSNLDTLGFNFTETADLDPIISTVTVNGTSDIKYDIDLHVSGISEYRNYATLIERVGGGGRFITATDYSASEFPTALIVILEISDPVQTYYLNAQILGDSDFPRPSFTLDGGDDAVLNVTVAGGATITLSAYPVDGTNSGLLHMSILHNFNHYDGIGAGPVALSDVASDLMERAGLTSDQFDVSQLTDQIAGVAIQDTSTGADALNACISPFFADSSEYDGQLHYVKRGAPVVRTLTIDDLTEEPDVPSRENVIEYPAKLSFFYQSPLTGYATTKETSVRYSPQSTASSEASVTVPITFADSNIPAEIAVKLHKVLWTEAEGAFTWTVGQECIDLVPADPVGLYLRGIATRARVVNIDNNGTTLTLTMMKDRQSSYTANATPIPLPLPTPPLPTTMSTAVLAVMDIPALQDSDDQLCYYTAMSGSTSVWSGGQLQRSLDGGSTWVAIGEAPSDVTMGRLTVAMTGVDSSYTDTTNTVTVQLFDKNNELVSYSDTEFLNEQGAIAVQLDDGTYELMQYRDAVDGGSGLWTLSHLQRGRRNTVSGEHGIGALFVFLDTDVVKNTAQTAYLGTSVQHRAVSYGSSAEAASVVTITYHGLSQTEWSPASAVAEFDGSTLYVHDIVPRQRFGTDVNPVASVNYEGLQVTLTDGTTNVIATVTTGNSAHISAAPLLAVTSVSIAEVNKLTGAGTALVITPTVVAAGSLAPEAIVNAGGA